jgi:hypothetical protein
LRDVRLHAEALRDCDEFVSFTFEEIQDVRKNHVAISSIQLICPIATISETYTEVAETGPRSSVSHVRAGRRLTMSLVVQRENIIRFLSHQIFVVVFDLLIGGMAVAVSRVKVPGHDLLFVSNRTRDNLRG